MRVAEYESAAMVSSSPFSLQREDTQVKGTLLSFPLAYSNFCLWWFSCKLYVITFVNPSLGQGRLDLIVKVSQVVELTCPQKVLKAKVKWDRS